jgi:hypothetical protein
MAKISKKTALLWILVVAGLLVIWRFIVQPIKQKDEAITPMMSTETSEPTPQQVVASESERAASVRTQYKNPGGEDEVGYSITVDENDVITKVGVEVLAKNPTSKLRQEAFAAGLPGAIQGKKITELTSIDKVGGSSLTTASFNASLAQLKAEL